MEAKPILLLFTAVCLFFGIGLLLAPEMILNMSSVSVLGAGPFLSQHTGALVFAVGILTFLIRNEEHSNCRQSIFLFMIIGLTLLVIIDVIGFFMEFGDIMMWLTISIHALFVILFTYLYMDNR